MPKKENRIHPEMTVIDTITRYRETEQVFKKFDTRAGPCICCDALFDTIGVVAETFHLELDSLLSELNAAAGT